MGLGHESATVPLIYMRVKTYLKHSTWDQWDEKVLNFILIIVCGNVFNSQSVIDISEKSELLQLLLPLPTSLDQWKKWPQGEESMLILLKKGVRMCCVLLCAVPHMVLPILKTVPVNLRSTTHPSSNGFVASDTWGRGLMCCLAEAANIIRWGHWMPGVSQSLILVYARAISNMYRVAWGTATAGKYNTVSWQTETGKRISDVLKITLPSLQISWNNAILTFAEIGSELHKGWNSYDFALDL